MEHRKGGWEVNFTFYPKADMETCVSPPPNGTKSRPVEAKGRAERLKMAPGGTHNYKADLIKGGACLSPVSHSCHPEHE